MRWGGFYGNHWVLVQSGGATASRAPFVLMKLTAWSVKQSSVSSHLLHLHERERNRENHHLNQRVLCLLPTLPHSYALWWAARTRGNATSTGQLEAALGDASVICRVEAQFLVTMETEVCTWSSYTMETYVKFSSSSLSLSSHSQHYKTKGVLE